MTFAPQFRELAFFPAEAQGTLVFENEWSSFSKSGFYSADQTSPRSSKDVWQMTSFRPDRPRPASGFQGEGSLALTTDGAHHLFATPAPRADCPSIRLETRDDSLVVSADSAIDAHNLPIDVIGVDDAFQWEIGDWATLSDRVSSLPKLVQRINASHRRAGVWIAPFWVGARSGAKQYLMDVFHTWRGHGFDYFTLDFLFATLFSGRRHERLDEYEHDQIAVSTIREAVGSDATLLGGGAPLLPSVGLFDGMRASCDIDARFNDPSGDISQPSERGAVHSGRSRAFMHGRLSHNDPDCFIVRPEVEQREHGAAHIADFSGVRAPSNHITNLHDCGSRMTRELLVSSTAAPLIDSEDCIS